MMSVIGFLIILGPLVVVHEFGHYLFARLFGVKAEIFSIGFGPRLWARQIGETEWRVSAIPLGGFVKLLGEDRDAPLPPELAHRALHRAAPWKRFFIFFGGPLFNFLFAILVFMAILAIGEPQLASVAGRVVHGTPAEKAGFRSGDRILTVGGKPVRRFEEVLNEVGDHPNQTIAFEVIHRGQTQSVTISATPKQEEGFTVYGEQAQIGDIEGLSPNARAAQVGVSNPASLAAKAGIKTGDIITAMNGKPLSDWEVLEDTYQAAAPGTHFDLKLKRGDSEISAALTKSAGAGGDSMGTAWGLYSTELFIDKTVDKAPAATAGLKGGDRLISVGGQKMESFFELRDAVQKSGEKDGKVQVQWERDGQVMTASIVPTGTSSRDALLKKTTSYTIGIVPMLAYAEPDTVIERVWNPFKLVYQATERMVVFSWRNLVSIRKMFSGEVSVATLGGPIMIGKIAGESIARGLIAFLTTMGILSIGLGVLNVLPVPVLDGGHLLLLAVESIRRKPLTLRQMEIVQGVGLSAILLLMGIVIKNDLSRLPIFN